MWLHNNSEESAEVGREDDRLIVRTKRLGSVGGPSLALVFINGVRVRVWFIQPNLHTTHLLNKLSWKKTVLHWRMWTVVLIGPYQMNNVYKKVYAIYQQMWNTDDYLKACEEKGYAMTP